MSINSKANLYTVTIDDDLMVHRMIQEAMDIPSINFESKAKFLDGIDTIDPLAIFVDINLRSESGLDLIHIIRTKVPYCPVMVITSNDDDDSIGLALAAGANDFIKKPINRKELLARFKIRFSEMSARLNRELVKLGSLTVNLRLNLISNLEREAALSPSETQLIAFLINSRGAIVSRDEIRRHLWGDLKVSDNALDKKIFEVRRALKDVSSCYVVQTSYGKGIRLIAMDPKEQAKLKRVVNG